MESKEFNIKGEGIFENAFTLDVNAVLHKYSYKNIAFNQASENQHGSGRRNRESKVGGAVRAGGRKLLPNGIVWNPCRATSVRKDRTRQVETDFRIRF